MSISTYMKRIRIAAAIVVAAGLVFACMGLEMPDPYTPATEDEAPAKYVPYNAEYISVPAGSQSLIYLGGTLVATCNKSGYVVLPKATSTKALSDYQIVNIPLEGDPGVASENKLEMVVAFEDTKLGDHDYNDLVFQARMKITNAVSGPSTVDIDITPIAMGATLQLGIGVVLTDSEGNVLVDRQITDNCRTFLFNGDEGFINTQQDRKHYDAVSLSITTESNTAVAGISWYLLTPVHRLYASNYFQAYMDDSNAPQGLVLMKIRDDIYYEKDGNNKYLCGNDFWQYPGENVPISEVYPGFEQAFLTGGDFSVFASPTGRYYDAIAADEDGCLSSDCLYDVYREDCQCIVDHEGGEEPPTSAELYYDNTGKASTTQKSFNAIYNIFDHTQDNFILEFSTAKGNAIDFSRGDYIEAKVTACENLYPFVIGDFNPTTTGKTIEGYCNGAHNWWRAQDNYIHLSASTSGGINTPTLAKPESPAFIVRISAANGIEYLVNGEWIQDVAPSKDIMAYVLTLGTDKPLFYGLFGDKYSTATYEYLKIVRTDGSQPDEPILVTSISVSDAAVYVNNNVTLTASVLPYDAENKTVTWSSSNEAVATVNASTGEVTGVAAGACTITATSTDGSNVTGSCTVTVSAVPVAGTEVFFDKSGNQYSAAPETMTVGTSETFKFALPPVDWAAGDYIEFKMDSHDVKGLKLTIGEENPTPSGGGACVDFFCETNNMFFYLEGWSGANKVSAFWSKGAVVTYQLSKEGLKYKIGDEDWSSEDLSAVYERIKDVSSLYVGIYGFCNQPSHESTIYYIKLVHPDNEE